MNWAMSLRETAPETLLSVVGLAMLLVAGWAGDRAARALVWIAAAALGLSAAMAAQALGGGPAATASVFYDQYTADAFSAFAKLLIDLSAAGALLVAPAFFARQGPMRAEYPVLVLFACVGLGLMVSATSLLTLYLGLELNSLSAYVLAAMLRGDARSAEAGLKYFVLGALASGILLFGISLAYGFSGAVGFAAIHAAVSGPLATGALFAVVFTLAGLAFKISAVPFHMWTPDVYEGAPTPVVAFFATAPKVAALALTMRVTLGALGGAAAAWQQVVMFVALASIIVGALGAIGQANIKRLLAYSSINNVGFILIGLAVGTPAGAAAMLVYLAIYVVMTLGSFVLVLMLADTEGEPIEAIADLAGLSRGQPLIAMALAFMMFSLAGIPPLFGFWGKFVVFQAAVAAGYVPLAAVGIAASVIGAFYYLKVVKVMFFDPRAARQVVVRAEPTHYLIGGLATFAMSALGYLATRWLGALAGAAAAALFRGA